MTILALHAENYPIVYIEVVLTFVCNLPEEDHGWFMALCQEVTQDCGMYSTNIGYEYLLSIVSRVTDLDTQWHLSKLSKRSHCPKCDICSLQSHSTEQHDPSKQCASDSSSTSKSSTQSNHHPSTHPPDHPSSHRANLTDSHDARSSDSDGSLLDADVYTNVAELPVSQCTINTLDEDKFFICLSVIVISPSIDSSTLYFNTLADGALIALPNMIKTL